MDLLEQLTAALDERYRVERKLGQGGMAVVLLAHDLKHRRRVAIKLLKPELSPEATCPPSGSRWQERSAVVAYLLIDPRLAPLRDDPRFLALAQKLGGSSDPSLL